jgi:hypothetical protein
LQKIEQKFEAIPLTAGRSAVSREFCPVLVQELRKMAQHESSTTVSEPSAAASGTYSNIHDILNHPVNPVLKTYVTFAVNCQRRTQREEELREMRDMEASEPPFIPEPGLPPLQDLPDKDATTWILEGQGENADNDLPQHDEWDQVDFETDWQSRE